MILNLILIFGYAVVIYGFISKALIEIELKPAAANLAIILHIIYIIGIGIISIHIASKIVALINKLPT